MLNNYEKAAWKNDSLCSSRSQTVQTNTYITAIIYKIIIL